MDNSANIYLDEEELESKIELLKKERENLENVLSRMKSNFNNMINYWSGDSGEKVYSYLNSYTNDFSIIMERLDTDINFLERVIDAHRKMDNAIINRIEENSNIQI